MWQLEPPVSGQCCRVHNSAKSTAHQSVVICKLYVSHTAQIIFFGLLLIDLLFVLLVMLLLLLLLVRHDARATSLQK
jgi:hypothetical protein